MNMQPAEYRRQVATRGSSRWDGARYLWPYGVGITRARRTRASAFQALNEREQWSREVTEAPANPWPGRLQRFRQCDADSLRSSHHRQVTRLEHDSDALR